jgi:DNA polymerase-3 subunit alpha
MVTLEDLVGTVQVLCMNENYDKYRELLTQGRPILVIGEVNNGDDKPKIFPQEIMPLEDAPRKFTKQVHLRLNAAQVDPEKLGAIQQLISNYPGKCPLFLCFTRSAGDIVYMETHEKFFVAPSRQLQQAADELFGKSTYYAKVDTSLPERQRRSWERKPEMSNGQE